MKDFEFNPHYSLEKKARERVERGYRTEVEIFGSYNLEKAIKILNKQIAEAGIIRDYKEHSTFQKPSVRRRRKKLKGLSNIRNRKIKEMESGRHNYAGQFPHNLSRFTQEELGVAEDTRQQNEQIAGGNGDYDDNDYYDKESYRVGGRFSKAKTATCVMPKTFQEDNSNDIQIVAIKIIATMHDFIVVVLDKTKKDRYGNFLFGFPGGELENLDEGAVSAGEREFKEEVGVEISLSPSDFFSYLPVSDKKVIAIAVISLDDLVEVEFKPGEEIEDVFLMTAEEIKELIKNGRFVKSDAVFFGDYLTKNQV